MNATYGLGQKTLSDDLMQRLLAYDWPGNVRELHGVIESIYILNRASQLTTEHLPKDFLFQTSDTRVAEPPDATEEISNLDTVEKQFIAQALADSNVSLEAIAEQLGISRSTLYRKMKRYKLSR